MCVRLENRDTSTNNIIITGNNSTSNESNSTSNENNSILNKYNLTLDKYNLLPIPNQLFSTQDGKFQLTDSINGPFISFDDLKNNPIYEKYQSILDKPNIDSMRSIKINTTNNNQLTVNLLKNRGNFSGKIYKSFGNIGNSCFYGSVIHLLQQINFTDVNRTSIDQNKYELYDLIVGNLGISNILGEQFKLDSSVYDQSVKDMNRIPRQQQDAHEFLLYVINNVFKLDTTNNKLKMVINEDMYHAAGKKLSNKQTNTVYFENTITEKIVGKDMEKLFYDNMVDLAELNSYRENNVDNIFAYKFLYYNNFNDYIIIKNNIIGSTITDASKINLNMTIEFTNNDTYLLTSVVYFIGNSLDSGHYVSAVFNNVINDKLRYIYYNDSIINYADIDIGSKYFTPTVFESVRSTHIPYITLYKKMN